MLDGCSCWGKDGHDSLEEFLSAKHLPELSRFHLLSFSSNRWLLDSRGEDPEDTFDHQDEINDVNICFRSKEHFVLYTHFDI